jgi:hypothetical protein
MIVSLAYQHWLCGLFRHVDVGFCWAATLDMVERAGWNSGRYRVTDDLLTTSGSDAIARQVRGSDNDGFKRVLPL